MPHDGDEVDHVVRDLGSAPAGDDGANDADDLVDDKEATTERLEEAKREYEELGGWDAFRTGDWLLPLIRRSFKNYWERANVEYFREKYGTSDPVRISAKLISVAARNAGMLGAATGAVISIDEIVALATGAEAGIGLPANLAIAAVALSGEAIALVRIQMHLVANLAKLYGVPLDPDDPEDILTILGFALGGATVEAAGKGVAKAGGKLAGNAAKGVFKKDVLKAVQKIGAKAGVKILQRTIVKYVVPVASIGIGTGWNYFATRAVGKLAIRSFSMRAVELGVQPKNM